MTAHKCGSQWIPLARPSITNEDVDAVVAVLRSGQLVQGPVTAQLETKLAALLDVEHAVAVSSGTAALHLSLLALGLGPGDEVIVPAFSFIASANSIALTGATPVFVDVTLQDLNMDPVLVEAAITKRTRAILVVHEFGRPADLEPLLALATAHGLAVVEDAACGLGSAFKGRALGSHGTLGCFSFHPRKVATSGEGGLVVTSSSDLADSIRSMRAHGLNSRNPKRQYSLIGFNYRMTDIHASLLASQLDRLTDNLTRRDAIAEMYFHRLKNTQIELPPRASNGTMAWQTFHILAKSKSVRDQLEQHLRRCAIETSVAAQCIPDEPAYAVRYEGSQASWPNARAARARGLALPIYESLEDSDVQRIVDAINSFGVVDD